MTRFEALFESVGLPKEQIEPFPPLPGTDKPDRDEVFRILNELWAIRNVVVHRTGIVDEKFRKECSSLDIPVGDPVTISLKKFNLYSIAAASYFMQLSHRLAEGYEQLVPDSEE